MFKNSRSRWGLFALVLVLALAFAAMTTASAVTGPAGTLSLHVANGTALFTYTPTVGSPETQSSLPFSAKCVVAVSGNLVDMTASDRGLGLVGTSIGVKTGSSAGTPCGRVDTTETMSLTLDNVPNAGSVELDLELKGSAKVQVVLELGGSHVGTFEIRSGSSIVPGQGVEGTNVAPFSLNLTAAEPMGNCRNASDSGPDSGGNDNCRVSIIPASEFDTVKFVALFGEFSLEGGGDAGTSDTLFNLVATFEGELGCTEGNNEASDDGGLVDASITRYENTDGSECVLKPYNLTASDSDGDGNPSVTFDVADPGSQAAVYEAFLTFDQELTNPLSATLTYDPTAPYADFVEIPPCVEDPFDLEPSEAGSLNDEAIPAGDTACVVDVSQSWDGTSVWHVIFSADIKFR